MYNHNNISSTRFIDDYFLIKKDETNKKIVYIYYTPYSRDWQSELYLIKSKFSKEDLDFIDELFKNLSKDNLAIIKGLISARNEKINK